MRRKLGNTTYWETTACAGCAGAVSADDAVDAAHTMNKDSSERGDIVPPIEVIRVSRAKANAIIKERRANARRHKRCVDDVKRTAKLRATSCQGEQQIGRLNVAELHEILFPIDKSHRKVIVCGGYVGCISCGRFASTLTASNRLGVECRRYCPHGSQGATKRLLKGKHLVAQTSNSWPNGECDPTPKRVRIAP